MAVISSDHGELEEFHQRQQLFYETNPPMEQHNLPKHLKPRRHYNSGMASYHKDMRYYHKGERLRLEAKERA